MGNFVLYRNGKRTDITGSIEKISQYVDATQLALKHRWQRIYKHESVFSNEIPIKNQKHSIEYDERDEFYNYGIDICIDAVEEIFKNCEVVENETK